MRKIIVTTLSVAPIALALSACANHTQDIAPQYVSPMEYNSYSCRQIEDELHAVSRRASDVGARVDKTATDDSIQMGVGLLLFWPTLFFLDGDTPQSAEYARLRGEFEALEKTGRQKGCGIHVASPAPRVVKPAEVKPKPAHRAQDTYN